MFSMSEKTTHMCKFEKDWLVGKKRAAFIRNCLYFRYPKRRQLSLP